MGYQSSALDATGISIVTQVAFKGAVDLTVGVTDEERLSSFATNFEFLREALLAAVRSEIGSQPSAPVSAPAASAENVIHAAFGGTTEVVTTEAPASVQIVGAQHGPIPAWLIQQAAAKGVTKVFDNRDRAVANPKYPLFKGAEKGTDIPFWAPKGA